MPYKLGKKPARKGAVKLQFTDYFDLSKLPTPPVKFGHHRVHRPWEMLGNDNYGDCVFAGGDHETMIWCAATGTCPRFDEKSALSDYAAVTGFDPKRPDTDQGTDMEEAAKYRRQTGLIDADGNRHKIAAYLAIHPGRVDHMMIANYLCGAIGIGIRFPASAMDQFDKGEVWSPVPHSKVDGGHYIPGVGRNSKNNPLVVTWGRLHAGTPEFFEEYCDEVIAYISDEFIDRATLMTPDGFLRDALMDDLKQLAA